MLRCLHRKSCKENVIVGIFFTLTIAVSGRSRWSRNVSPSFIDTNTNVTVYKGATATLPCSVLNLGTKKVVWKRENEQHPLTIGDFVFTNDARYYIDHPGKSYQWNLVIKAVAVEHAGMYDCQISTKEDMYRKVKLSVTELPQTAIHIAGPNFTEKGEPIRITCNATTNSLVPDFMDWFQNGRKLKDSQEEGISISEHWEKESRTLYSTLEINSSSMDDAGSYICRNSRRDVVSHYVIVLNADSSHEKRGFQETIDKISSHQGAEVTPRNAALNNVKNIHSLLYNLTLFSFVIFLFYL